MDKLTWKSFDMLCEHHSSSQFVHEQIMLAFQCMFVSPIIHSKLQVRFLHLETVVQTNKEFT